MAIKKIEIEIEKIESEYMQRNIPVGILVAYQSTLPLDNSNPWSMVSASLVKTGFKDDNMNSK